LQRRAAGAGDNPEAGRLAVVPSQIPALGQLAAAADWCDDVDEPRACSMLLSAPRSVLAAAHLIAPAMSQELLDIVEQSGWDGHRA
jgi:hypothetical protein